MAANVLNSQRAIEASVYVVRAFVKMREVLSTHKELVRRLDEMEGKVDRQFEVVFDAIRFPVRAGHLHLRHAFQHLRPQEGEPQFEGIRNGREGRR